MGREKEFPLTPELEENLLNLLHAVNIVREAYGKPMIVSSGYRPGYYNINAHGAKFSPHMTCEAVDFKDPTGELSKWAIANIALIANAGLYIEDPAHTKGWLHCQTRKIPSGRRIFSP